jgi:hypothetical protein
MTLVINDGTYRNSFLAQTFHPGVEQFSHDSGLSELHNHSCATSTPSLNLTRAIEFYRASYPAICGDIASMASLLSEIGKLSSAPADYVGHNKLFHSLEITRGV